MSTIVNLFRRKNSEQEEFAALLRPHVDLMYRMAYRWSRNQEDAEDIVQDVLIKLANRIADMQAVDNLRPWLIKIVYHRFVDLSRQRKRQLEIIESDLPSSAHATHTGQDLSPLDTASCPDPNLRLELQDALNQALDAIDSDQRDVILLHDAEGYTATEVAEILAISVGTVKSRLHRGREKLKIILRPGTFRSVATCQELQE